MIDESTMSWSKSLSCKDLGVARGHDLYITVPVADAESGFFPPVPITAAQKCEVDLPIRDSWGKSWRLVLRRYGNGKGGSTYRLYGTERLLAAMGLQPADLFVIRRGTDGYYVPALRASGEPRNVPKRRVQSSADDRLAAVELIEWDGCSIADVADLLETSVGSVYAWRRQLRDQITTRERAAAKPVAQGEAAPGEPAACGSGPTEVSYALGRDMGPKPSAVPQAGRAGSNWKMAVVGKELTKTDTGESRTHTNGVNCDNAFVGFFRDERGALPDAITAVDSAGRLWRLEIRKYGTAPQYRLVGQAMGYIRANQLRSGDELRFEKIPVPGTFSISHVRLTGGDHVPSGSAAYPSQRGKTDRRRPRTPLARVVAAR